MPKCAVADVRRTPVSIIEESKMTEAYEEATDKQSKGVAPRLQSVDLRVCGVSRPQRSQWYKEPVLSCCVPLYTNKRSQLRTCTLASCNPLMGSLAMGMSITRLDNRGCIDHCYLRAMLRYVCFVHTFSRPVCSPSIVRARHEGNPLPEAAKIITCACSRSGFSISHAQPQYQLGRYQRTVLWSFELPDELAWGLRVCRVL